MVLSFNYLRTQGATVGFKPEFTLGTTGGSLVNGNIYLLPFNIDAVMTIDTIEVDQEIIQQAGTGGSLDLQYGIYEQVDRLNSAGITANLVAGSTVTLTGQTLGTVITTLSLDAPITLQPGAYWVTYMGDNTAPPDLLMLQLNAVVRNLLIPTMRFANESTHSGATLPQTLTGTNLGANDFLEWASVVYSGDALP